MCHALIWVVTFALIVLKCHALNCRSDGGPKESELKTVYMTCLKKQEGKNSSDIFGQSDDQEWKEQRQSKFNQKKAWNKNGMRDMDDPMRDRNDRDDKDDRRSHDRTGGRDDRINRDDRMGGRDSNMNRNNMMERNNNGFGREQFAGRYDFPQSEEYDSDASRYNGYHSTTHSPRRFKRSKRGQKNSGQRSQYNPNSKKQSDYEDTYKDDDRNSSNSSEVDSKACALHCFMEQLEMTGDDGMPDKYLVTHAITKDVKNEDLRDFLQESIEECFQILDNENTEDKCEFSKNLMMCLSEKGRANCDDWKDDLKF